MEVKELIREGGKMEDKNYLVKVEKLSQECGKTG
jgi:hypothetical protein